MCDDALSFSSFSSSPVLRDGEKKERETPFAMSAGFRCGMGGRMVGGRLTQLQHQQHQTTTATTTTSTAAGVVYAEWEETKKERMKGERKTGNHWADLVHLSHYFASLHVYLCMCILSLYLLLYLLSFLFSQLALPNGFFTCIIS